MDIRENKLPTLFSLDKKGKIRSFNCTYKYAAMGDDTWSIKTSTGLLRGKKISKVTLVKSGKAGRSTGQQAELQARSKYNEKLDEGYKSYSTLKHMWIERETFKNGNVLLRGTATDRVECLYKELGIKWNTSQYHTPLPMLAKPYSSENLSKGYIAQPKLDGVRNIALIRGESLKMCSRGGKFYIGLDHIEKELNELFHKYPHLMTDGELYTHGVTQNEISGAARKQKRGMFADYTWLQYHIYDLPIINGSEQLQVNRESTRIIISRELSEQFKYIKFLPSHIVHTYEEAKVLHDKYVAEGYEGLILRDPDAPYMFSFRDKCLLKLKVFVIEQFQVDSVQCVPGDISTFTFNLLNEEGTIFGCRAKGSHRLWQRYYDNPPIGEFVDVRYINRSDVNNVPEKATVQPIAKYDKWD